jgi:SAM-dependent methyltransferase
MAPSELLADPIGFWDQRHATFDPWRSGGDRGISPEENFEFYAVRLGRLLELIRWNVSAERGLRILDAGCGRGHLTDGLRRCGHRVVGIDSSATAVAWARETYGDPFVECRLDDLRPEALFDVVVCVDVLFHVLDDGAWRAALAAFSRYAGADAALIVTDVFPARRYNVQNYIVHRSADEYEAALAEHDFARVALVPYRFGSNPNQFAVYRRSA